MADQQLSQIQQLLGGLNSSVIQLHGKLDNVGMQITTSSSNNNSNSSMNNNGNNNMMQQMMQMMQGQQFQNSNQFNNNNNINRNNNNNINNSNIRIKSDDLVSSIEAIVAEYEQCMNENKNGGGAAKEALTKLEDKIEVLQVIYKYNYVLLLIIILLLLIDMKFILDLLTYFI
jgi:hypothetical protein